MGNYEDDEFKYSCKETDREIKRIWASLLSFNEEVRQKENSINLSIEDQKENVKKCFDRIDEIKERLLNLTERHTDLLRQLSENREDDLKTKSEFEKKIIGLAKKETALIAKETTGKTNKKWIRNAGIFFTGLVGTLKAIELYWSKIAEIIDKLF